MTELYDIRLLGPDDIYLSRSNGGVLQGVVDGQPYEELTVYRTFPFRYATAYISIRDAKDKELGIVRDIAELNEESADELAKELEFRYFLPRVTRIESVKLKSGLWIWELQTHLGPTRMTMRNLHEYMQFSGDARIILVNMNGKRCEIPDWRALDAHSRRQLEDVL